MLPTHTECTTGTCIARTYASCIAPVCGYAHMFYRTIWRISQYRNRHILVASGVVGKTR